MKILKKLQMIKPVLPAMLLGIFVWEHKFLAAGMLTTESQTLKAGKKEKVLI